MAYTSPTQRLPSADDILAGVGKMQASQPAAPQSNTPDYDALTPEQKAEVDARVALQMNPRGAVGEMGAGLMRGLTYELPRMAGSALQATGKEGDFLHGVGTGIESGVEPMRRKYMADPDAHGTVVNTIAEGLSMVAPSVAPLLAAPVAGIGAAALGGAALFGASQFQDTYEKAKAAGKSDQEAYSLGLQTGAIEAGGEYFGTKILGKFFTGAAKPFAKGMTAEQAAESLKNPQFWRTLGKNYAKMTAGEVATEMGQAGGQAAVESGAGLESATPWEAATHAIGPTLVLSTFLAPFGGVALRSQQQHAKKVIEDAEKVVQDPATAGVDQVRATKSAADLIASVTGNKEAAQQWRLDQLAGADTAKRNADALAGGGFLEPSPVETPAGIDLAPLEPTAPDMSRQMDFEEFRPLELSSLGLEPRTGPAATSAPRMDASGQGTLDLDAPYRRGARQSVVDEASARIAAAAVEPAVVPAQGTAAMLGLVPGTPGQVEVPDQMRLREPTVKLTAQRRTAILKDLIPTLPSSVRAELVGLESPQFAEAIRQVWHARGGEAGPAYNEAIEQVYTAITGTNIRDTDVAPVGSERPAFALSGDSVQTGERVADEQTTQQHAQVQDALAADKASKTATKQRMGDLFSGKPTPTTKESRAREAQTKFTNVVLSLKSALDAFDQQVQETPNEAAPQVSKGTQPQPAADEARPVTPAAAPKGAKQAGNAQPSQNAPAAAKGVKDAIPKPSPSEVPVQPAPAAGEKVAKGVPPKGGQAAAKAGDAKTGTTVVQAKGVTKTKHVLKKDKAPVSAEQAAIDAALDRQPVPKSTVHGNVKDTTGTAATDAERQEQYQADQRQKLQDTLAKYLAKVRGAKQAAAQDKAKAERLMGMKGSVWRFDSDWLNEKVDRELGVHSDEFRKEARAVQTEFLGTGKDTALDDEAAAKDVQDQAKAEREFSAKEEARVIDEVEEQEAFDADEAGVDLGDVGDRDQKLGDGPLPSSHTQEYTAMRNADVKTVGEALKLLRDTGTDIQRALIDALLKVPGVANMDLKLKGFDGNEMGYYYPKADGRHVGLRTSATLHTLLHEAVHVATHSAISRGQNKAQMEKLFQAAKAALADNPKFKGEYPFKNMHEFVAEAFSNKAFQKFLASVDATGEAATPENSLFAKFMSVVRRVLGIPKRTLSDEVFAASEGLFTGPSEMGVDAEAAQSIAGSFAEVKSAVGSLNQQYGPKMLENFPSLFNLAANVRKQLLGIATAHHIKEWVGQLPILKEVQPLLNAFFKAYDNKTFLIQSARQEFQKYLSHVERDLADIATKMSKAGSKVTKKMLSARLMELGGEMSRLDLNLDKSFASQQDIDPALRPDFDRLQSLWNNLDPKLRQHVRDGIKINRKFYIANTVAIVHNVLTHYREQDQTGVLGKYITKLNLLDIDEAKLGNVDDVPAALARTLTAQQLAERKQMQRDRYIDATSRHLDEQLNEVLTDIRANVNLTALKPLVRDLKSVEEYYHKAMKNPYMHLGRDGAFFARFTANIAGNTRAASGNTKLGELGEKYGAVVGAVTKDNPIAFMRFKTLQQAQMFAKEAEAAGLISTEGTAEKLRVGRLNEEGLLDSMAGVPQFIRGLMSKLDDKLDGGFTREQRDNIRMTLMQVAIDLLPETSPQKALARRQNEGRVGYEADYVHNFAKRAEGMSTSIANAFTLPALSEALSDMGKTIDELSETDPQAQARAQEVRAELSQRFTNSLNPIDSPVIDKAKALGYNYFLALSPAFMLVNSMQPYHLALPIIGSRYGFAKTWGVMLKSAGTSMSLLHDTYVKGWKDGKFIGMVDSELLVSKLSPAHQELVKELMRSGRLDFTQAHELGRMASGGSHGVQLVAKVLSLGSHITELNNRLTVALAAYDLAVEAGVQPKAAIEYSSKMVDDTQYNYADHNTARFLGRHGLLGKLTPLVMSFQQYSFQSMELLARLTRDAFFNANPEFTDAERKEARKALGMVVGMTGVIAGSLGLPFASAVAAIVDGIVGDDDEPFDSKIAYRNWLAEVLGKDVAEMVARGVPRALGVDVSARAGWQDIMPGSRFLTDKRQFQDAVKDGALNMYGPAVNAGVDIFTGLSLMGDGRFRDGLIESLPLALRNPVKAAKLADEGFTSKTGNKLPMDVTSWDVMNQALGFTPAKKAEQSEANFAFKTREAQLKHRGGQIANDLYKAVEHGEDITPAVEAYTAFAQKHPEMAGSPATAIKERAKAREVAKLSGTGIAAPTSRLPTLKEYGFANTGIQR